MAHEHNHDCGCGCEHEHEREENFVTLIDEEGNEEVFEVLAVEEIDGGYYAALFPVNDEEEDEESDEATFVVLKIEDKDGEELLMPVEDEDEFNRVAEYFSNLFSEEFDVE